MANGILELEPTVMRGGRPLTPQEAMLDQQFARMEQQQAQQLANQGTPQGAAGGQPRMTPQGLLAMPGAQQPGPMPGGFGGQQGMDRMNQIYGLLAQYADDPTKVGQQYVGAVQLQEQINRRNTPMETFLRMYGNINPYDFEADSIQAFHESFVASGQPNFSLLKRKEELSSTEQGILRDAITRANEREITLGRMSNLADRFEAGGLQGMRSGVIASADEWIKGLVGGQDQYTALRTEYDQVKNKLVVSGLPPGVASDTDIKIAMDGWPGRNAGPEYIASFLRGMMKIQAIEHAQSAHEAGWLSRNRSQEGQLEDWQRNRDVLSQQAIQQFGGVYAPVDAQGNPLNPQDAAMLRYSQFGGATPPGGGGAPAPTLPPGTNLDDVEDSALVDYYLRQGGPQ